MMRLVLTFGLLAALSSTASARLESPRLALPGSVSGATSPKLSGTLAMQAVPVEPPAEAVMTKKTQVLLNGKVAALATIPEDAEITKMELDSDGKTILRIEFRTK